MTGAAEKTEREILRSVEKRYRFAGGQYHCVSAGIKSQKRAGTADSEKH